jgi:hypothetical protein
LGKTRSTEFATATGSYYAIRQNYRHLRSHCFIDIRGQLGRSGAARFLTNHSGFEYRIYFSLIIRRSWHSKLCVFIRTYHDSPGLCSRTKRIDGPAKNIRWIIFFKILDTTVSPVDAQALFADDLLLIPKWIIDLWKDNADVAVSKSNGEIPSGLVCRLLLPISDYVVGFPGRHVP